MKSLLTFKLVLSLMMNSAFSLLAAFEYIKTNHPIESDILLNFKHHCKEEQVEIYRYIYTSKLFGRCNSQNADVVQY